MVGGEGVTPVNIILVVHLMRCGVEEGRGEGGGEEGRRGGGEEREDEGRGEKGCTSGMWLK